MTFACDFNFETFPFDDHFCDLEFGTPTVKSKFMIFAPIHVLNNGTQKRLSNEKSIQNNHLPFEFSLMAKESFTLWTKGAQYPATGIRIHAKRNQLGTILGQFYFPTIVFALLSMMSYFINPEIVSTVF